jgi:hypothetical protein
VALGPPGVVISEIQISLHAWYRAFIVWVFIGRTYLHVK